MVYAHDSKSCGAILVGSSPTSGTKKNGPDVGWGFFIGLARDLNGTATESSPWSLAPEGPKVLGVVLAKTNFVLRRGKSHLRHQIELFFSQYF